MFQTEHPTVNLRGMYHDIIYDSNGRIILERGWKSNTIVVDCRRLLAGFLHGTPTGSLGIQGLQVGIGNPAWDAPPGLPLTSENQTALVDPKPYTLPKLVNNQPNPNFQMDFLNGNVISATPTNRLQIVAKFGPNQPNWPDPNHASLTLREFGLVGQLDGQPALINYVIHPAIIKDPTSTLERTIWLVF